MRDEGRFFSEREHGRPPTDRDQLDDRCWGGLLALLLKRLRNQLFAYSFPESCPDNNAALVATDEAAFWQSLRGWVPGAPDRFRDSDTPDVVVAMDIIEFLYDHVTEYSEGSYHRYFDHHHLTNFNPGKAQRELREEANRLLQRNRMAYELDAEGRMRRLGPPVLREAIADAAFESGDGDLDDLLNRAREKFRSPDVALRRESLEQLWDAFERLKSVMEPASKKQSVEALIAATGLSAEFQRRLEAELRALTAIGNDFRIRHSEVSKWPVETSEQVDYLFSRMFALIWLLLRVRQ